ncbi:MAG: phosphotransferase, partial [Intrasporangiaceae bacterium]|nr:phosphotransferase [Intrasporangiaceae bacterium]
MTWRETEVDEDPARRLLAKLPDSLRHLRNAPIRSGGAGWDNAVWRVGERYALRLPVSAPAAGALELEARWVDVVSEPMRAKGIRVPRPLHHGRIGSLYPWSWLLVEWVPAFHRPAPPNAPVNPGRGAPLSVRHPMTLRAAERAGPHLGDHTVTALLEIVEE